MGDKVTQGDVRKRAFAAKGSRNDPRATLTSVALPISRTHSRFDATSRMLLLVLAAAAAATGSRWQLVGDDLGAPNERTKLKVLLFRESVAYEIQAQELRRNWMTCWAGRGRVHRLL
jgi:hypothetical protein